MTDFTSANRALHDAICQYTNAREAHDGGEAAKATWAINDAITALDNAAYDRAYEQAQEACPTPLQVRMDLVNARTESLRLKQQLELAEQQRRRWEDDAVRLLRERDEERQRTTVMTLANDDKRQELRRLKQDLEFAEHRREQAEKELRRLQTAYGGERRAVVWLRRKYHEARTELSDARDTTRRLADAHADVFATSLSLRAALETLADRYHAQCCYKNRRSQHSRHGCSHVLAVQDANEALAGESEERRTETFEDATERRAQDEALAGEVETPRDRAARYRAQASYRCFPAPKAQPEIEAVLMGNAITCYLGCGCGRVVGAGQCAYRYPRTQSQWMQPLYASEACARKAARPKARTYPPYAAYTDAMRRENSE
jgi:hypothetical protein